MRQKRYSKPAHSAHAIENPGKTGLIAEKNDVFDALEGWVGEKVVVVHGAAMQVRFTFTNFYPKQGDREGRACFGRPRGSHPTPAFYILHPLSAHKRSIGRSDPEVSASNWRRCRGMVLF